MSLLLPEGLRNLFKGLTGMEWPEADEDKLREVAELYHRTAGQFPQLATLFNQVVATVKADFEGETADAFLAAMGEFVGDKNYLGVAAEQAKQLGDFAHDVANQVEYSKWMIIGQLIQLAAEIAFAIALGPFGAVAWAEVAVEELFTREFIINVLRYLLKAIVIHTTLGVTTMSTMDQVIQHIQIDEGHRDHKDASLTLQAVEFGGLAGLIGGPIVLVGGLAGKWVGNIFGQGLRRTFENEFGNVLAKGLGNETDHVFTNDLARGADPDAARAGADDLAHSTDDLGGLARHDEPDETTPLLRAESEDTLTSDLGRLGDETGRGLGRDIGNLFAKVWPQLQNGFVLDAGTGLVRSVSQAVTDELGAIFERNLGRVLGPAASRELGRDYAQAFMANWAAKDLTAVKATLGKVLAPFEGQLGTGGVRALSHELPDSVVLNLARGSQGDLRYKLSSMVTSAAFDGVHQNLTEGFYNLIFSPEHRFTTTWLTAGAGFATGLFGRAGHTFVAHPLTEKFQNLVHGIVLDGGPDPRIRSSVGGLPELLPDPLADKVTGPDAISSPVQGDEKTGDSPRSYPPVPTESRPVVEAPDGQRPDFTPPRADKLRAPLDAADPLPDDPPGVKLPDQPGRVFAVDPPPDLRLLDPAKRSFAHVRTDDGTSATWSKAHDVAPVPWSADAQVYVVGVHGRSGKVILPLADGSHAEEPGTKLGQVLHRRPSLNDLPRKAPIILTACEAAFAGDDGIPVAQKVANVARRPVWATTGRLALLDRDYLSFGLGPDAEGRRGEWIEFHPQSGDATDTPPAQPPWHEPDPNIPRAPGDDRVVSDKLEREDNPYWFYGTPPPSPASPESPEHFQAILGGPSDGAGGPADPGEHSERKPPWYWIESQSFGDGGVSKAPKFSAQNVDKLVSKIRRGLNPNDGRQMEDTLRAHITSDDAKHWERLMLRGAAVSYGDRRVTLTVVPNTTHSKHERRPDPDDPTHQQYLSKYGDTKFSRLHARIQKSWILRLVFDPLLFIASKPLGHFSPSVRLSMGANRVAHRGFSTEVQSGNRVLANPVYEFTTEVTIHAEVYQEGRKTTELSVTSDEPLHVTFPRAFSTGTITDEHEWLPVTNPDALQGVDYALNAIDARPAVKEVRRQLEELLPGHPHAVDELVQDFADEFLNEKTVKDRSQFLLTRSWRSKLFQKAGFKGHFRVAAVPKELRYLETTDKKYNIRNDMAATLDQTDGRDHSSNAGLDFGMDFGFPRGPHLATLAAKVLWLGSKRTHTRTLQSQGQAKVALMRADHLVRYEVKFDLAITLVSPTHGDRELSVRTMGELAVGDRHAAVFEPAALDGKTTERQPKFDGPAPTGPWLYRPDKNQPEKLLALPKRLRGAHGGSITSTKDLLKLSRAYRPVDADRPRLIRLRAGVGRALRNTGHTLLPGSIPKPARRNRNRPLIIVHKRDSGPDNSALKRLRAKDNVLFMKEGERPEPGQQIEFEYTIDGDRVARGYRTVQGEPRNPFEGARKRNWPLFRRDGVTDPSHVLELAEQGAIVEVEARDDLESRGDLTTNVANGWRAVFAHSNVVRVGPASADELKTGIQITDPRQKQAKFRFVVDDAGRVHGARRMAMLDGGADAGEMRFASGWWPNPHGGGEIDEGLRDQLHAANLGKLYQALASRGTVHVQFGPALWDRLSSLQTVAALPGDRPDDLVRLRDTLFREPRIHTVDPYGVPDIKPYGAQKALRYIMDVDRDGKLELTSVTNLGREIDEGLRDQLHRHNLGPLYQALVSRHTVQVQYGPDLWERLSFLRLAAALPHNGLGDDLIQLDLSNALSREPRIHAVDPSGAPDFNPHSVQDAGEPTLRYTMDLNRDGKLELMSVTGLGGEIDEVLRLREQLHAANLGKLYQALVSRGTVQVQYGPGLWEQLSRPQMVATLPGDRPDDLISLRDTLSREPRIHTVGPYGAPDVNPHGVQDVGQPALRYIMDFNRDGKLELTWEPKVLRHQVNPDDLEPLALAARKGLGPGAVHEIPGAERILDAAQEALFHQLRVAGHTLSAEDQQQFEHELATRFGVPGIRAGFKELAAGTTIDHEVTVGKHTFRVSLSAELLGLRDPRQDEHEITVDTQLKSTMGVDVGEFQKESAGVGFEAAGRIHVGGPFAVDVMGEVGYDRAKNLGVVSSHAAKEYHRRKTNGDAARFEYETAYTLTVTGQHSDGRPLSAFQNRFEGSPFTSAVMVGEELLPPRKLTAQEILDFGRATRHSGEFDDLASEAKFMEGSRGQPGKPIDLASNFNGVYLSLHGTRDLSDLMARVVAKGTGGRPSDVLGHFTSVVSDRMKRLWGTGRSYHQAFRDTVQKPVHEDEDAVRKLVPTGHDVHEAILRSGTTTFLEANARKMLGREGLTIPLGHAADGYEHALIVKLKVFNADQEHFGTGVSLDQYNEGDLRAEKSDEREHSVGGSLGVSAVFEIGRPHSAAQESENPQPSNVSRKAGSQANVGGGGGYERSWSTENSEMRGALDLSTAAYSSSDDWPTRHYRGDLLYEVRHVKWREPTVGRFHHIADPPEYLRINRGAEFSVPQVRAIDLKLVEGDPPVTEPRFLLDEDIALGMSQVDKVDAPELLETVVDALRGSLLKDGRADIPSELKRALEDMFSEEAIRAHYGAARSTGIVGVLTAPFVPGGTDRYGIRVTLEERDLTYVRPLPGVKVTSGGQAFDEGGKGKGTESRWRVGLHGAARYGSPDSKRAPFVLEYGYERGTLSKTGEKTTERDIRRATADDESQEFRRTVGFRVEVFKTVEFPEIIREPGRLATAFGRTVSRPWLRLVRRAGGPSINEETVDDHPNRETAVSRTTSQRGFRPVRRAGWSSIHRETVDDHQNSQTAVSRTTSRRRFRRAGWSSIYNGTVDGHVLLWVPTHLTTIHRPDEHRTIELPMHWEVPNDEPAPAVSKLAEELATHLHAWALPSSQAWARALPDSQAWARSDSQAQAKKKHGELLADLTKWAPVVYGTAVHPASTNWNLIHVMLNERNLRANIDRLLHGTFEIPTDGGPDLTVQLVPYQNRWIATGKYNNALNFTEHAIEPAAKYEEIRHHDLAPEGGGGAAGGARTLHASEPPLYTASPAFGTEWDTRTSQSNAAGDYVEHNESRSGDFEYYAFDVKYIITGPNGRVVRTVPDGLKGMLPRFEADRIAEHNPLQHRPEPPAQVPPAQVPPASEPSPSIREERAFQQRSLRRLAIGNAARRLPSREPIPWSSPGGPAARDDQNNSYPEPPSSGRQPFPPGGEASSITASPPQTDHIAEYSVQLAIDVLNGNLVEGEEVSVTIRGRQYRFTRKSASTNHDEDRYQLVVDNEWRGNDLSRTELWAELGSLV